VEHELKDHLRIAADHAPETFAGFANTLSGLAKFLDAGAALARAEADDFPEKKIGEQRGPHYRRQDHGRLVRVGDRGATCTNTVVVEWENHVALPKPANCDRLTGQEVESVLAAERQAAERAAARICTDPECRYANTQLTFQQWVCYVALGADDQAEMSMWVMLQLELRCLPYFE
jgi:hypothetical protein